MEDFFHMIVATVLFLLALTIGFAGVRRLKEAMSSSAFAIGDTIAFESNLPIKADYIEGSQIVAMLLKNTEFGIRIVFCDGTSIEIEKDCIDVETVQRVCQADRGASREICMQVRKQQLELDMEQQTGSK